jgi:fatty-acyl-CoA synthase
MSINRTELREHYIRRFLGDPEFIRTIEDIEKIEQIPANERFPCQSPSDALALTSQHFPNEVALSYLPNGSASDKPIRWNYLQYHQEVTRAANLFHDLGLQADQSVIFLLPNVPQLLFGLWGAQLAGIATPINPYLEVEQIASVATSANARILVTLAPTEPGGEELWRKAMLAKQSVATLDSVITIGESATEESLSWAQATEQQPADRLIFDRKITGVEIASYFHTGGTTGAPKLAQHTHRKQVLNVCQMQLTGPRGKTSNGFSDCDKILCTLPLFHVNAAFVTALNAILGAGEVILAGPNGFRNPQLIEDFWSLVEKYQITFFAAVPTIYATLLERPIDNFDTSSLLNCGCGAAPMPVSLLESFAERTGANIMEGYGMTETIAVATTHYFFGDRKVGSVGMRIPYQTIRIANVDDNGNIIKDCETNEIGAILHSGISTFPGYKQQQANLSAWPEANQFNSGDMGRLDEEGYLWLVGRAKDLIIRGGHNIDPLVTEDALASHPAVKVAAAVGRPDSHSGEVPVAFVQLVEGATASEEELKSFARDNVGERAAAPVDVTICDVLPVTAVGKIYKPELRKRAIKNAFHTALKTAFSDTEFRINIADDKRLGIKVMLEVINTRGQGDLGTQLQEVLQHFTQHWELITPEA